MNKKSPDRKKFVLGMGLVYVCVAIATVVYYRHSQVGKSEVTPDMTEDASKRQVFSGDAKAPSEQARRFAVRMPVTYPNNGNELGNHPIGVEKELGRFGEQGRGKESTEPTMLTAEPEPDKESGTLGDSKIDELKPDYSDAEPPRVTTIRFEPRKVRHGDPLTVFVRVTDELSGVNTVSGVLRSPSGAAALPFRSERSTEDGVFIETLTIPDRAETGPWYFGALHARDKALNKRTYPEDSGLLRSSYFEVAGSDADSAPPEVTSVYLDPLEAYDGDTVKVLVEATDDKSGITMIYGVLLSPSTHAKIPFSCQKEGEGNTFLGQITIPGDAESGQWTVDYLQVRDESQNTRTFFRRDHPTIFDGASINVYANRSDSEPPTLDNLEIYPTALVYGETVEIVVYASDDVSGVGNVSGRLQSPSRRAHIAFSSVYDPDDLGYSAEVVIPTNAETGQWRVEYILITDKARNQIKYAHSSNPVFQEAYFQVIGE
jgi:hypothetical protein